MLFLDLFRVQLSRSFGSLLLARYAMMVDCRVFHFERSLLGIIHWYLFIGLLSCPRTQHKHLGQHLNHQPMTPATYSANPASPQNAVVCFSLFSNMFAIFCSSLVHFMLEEVVNSTVNRCLSPELMEPSVSRRYSLVWMLFHCVTRNYFLIDGSVELFENKRMFWGIDYGFLSWTGLD